MPKAVSLLIACFVLAFVCLKCASLPKKTEGQTEAQDWSRAQQSATYDVYCDFRINHLRSPLISEADTLVIKSALLKVAVDRANGDTSRLLVPQLPFRISKLGRLTNAYLDEESFHFRDGFDDTLWMAGDQIIEGAEIGFNAMGGGMVFNTWNYGMTHVLIGHCILDSLRGEFFSDPVDPLCFVVSGDIGVLYFDYEYLSGRGVVISDGKIYLLGIEFID